MNYKCYSCSEKQKKSKSGGFLKDFTNSKFGKFFMDWGYNNVAGIPVVGDNLAALTKYKPQTEFGQKVNDFGNNVVKPIVDPIATTALNMAVPGLGTGINAADQAANNAQGLNEDKKTGKSLNGINPLDGSRYAQTGGQVNSVKKVDGGTLNKISSTGIKAEGRLHEHGGININDEIEIEGGEGIHKLGNKTVISSDTLQDSDGYTFAEKMTELESKKGYLENRLQIEEDKGNKNTVIVLKKKIAEIDNEIKELYGKQELTAKEMGLRDKNGNPNQASQDIVPSPENPQPQGMLGKYGGSFKFKKKYQAAGAALGTEAATSSSSGFMDMLPNLLGSLGNMGSKKEEQQIPMYPPMQQPIVINNTIPETKPYFDQNQFAYDRMKLQNEMNYGRAKREMGGLINTTGYLKGHSTNKNPYNIIPSNIITTKGMKFPIEAVSDTGDKKILYPNQKEKVVFKGNYVVEKPLKAQNGLGMKKPYDPFKLNPPLIPPVPKNMFPPVAPPPSKWDKFKGGLIKGTEITAAASPAIGALIRSRMFKNKGILDKAPVNEIVPDGFNELKMLTKNLPYNMGEQNRNMLNSQLQTQLMANINSGERTNTGIAPIIGEMNKSNNQAMIALNQGMSDNYGKIATIDEKLKESYDQKKNQTLNEYKLNNASNINDVVEAFGKFAENANKMFSVYGPNGKVDNEKVLMKFLEQYPWMMQDSEKIKALRDLMNKPTSWNP